MRKIIQGLIFDMDGLLTDTERLHMTSYQKVFANHGYVLTDKDYIDHWITGGKSTGEYVNRHTPFDANQISREKAILFTEMLHTDLHRMPYALEIVKAFYGRIPMVVASSSLKKNVMGALELTGLLPYFDGVVTGDDVKRVKPDPEIFLIAANLIKMSPEHCLVLEDAQKGIRAATAAGMMSLAIPTDYTQDNDFSGAMAILKDLKEAQQWIENKI